MIVVLDTNVVLQALNQRHPFAVILNSWHAGQFTWAVSTDILLEYQEVIIRESGLARWQMLERLLDLAATYAENVRQVSPSFFFRTISADRDDDKFVDCAITVNADFIVTSDAHFRPLIGSGYRPQPITPEAFIERLLLKQP
ncbi:MAG: putative toxin-antitoxin system toxin component, PIN family [Prosthecobacter sp.]|uniref:putative toxin-antitoxin system toxin component, PIN family n=1 Tax=Prosthecobacter sp. TaxID=1965333 RepID=UPI0038FDB487